MPTRRPKYLGRFAVELPEVRLDREHLEAIEREPACLRQLFEALLVEMQERDRVHSQIGGTAGAWETCRQQVRQHGQIGESREVASRCREVGRGRARKIRAGAAVPVAGGGCAEVRSGEREVGRIRRREVRLGTTDPRNSDDALFVVATTGGTPHGYPKVLGLTDEPNLGTFGFPDVNLVESNGTFAFEATSASDSTSYNSVSVNALRESIGVKQLMKGGVRLEAELAKLAGNAAGEIPETGEYEVFFVVSPEAAGEIRKLEQQHPDDFAQACEISLRRVADRVNQLAGRQFEGRADAFAELAAGLAPELLPAALDDPQSWRRHLEAVLMELLDLSKLRDPLQGSDRPRPGVTQVDHLPSKTVVFPWPVGDEVPTCEVRVDTPNVASTTPPDRLVTFDRLKRRQAASSSSPLQRAVPDKPNLSDQDEVRFVSDVQSPAYDPESDLRGALLAGTKALAISAPVFDRQLWAYTCQVMNRPFAEVKFSARVLCSDLSKDDSVDVVDVVDVLPAVQWNVGDMVKIQSTARYATELVSTAAETDGISGVVADWNGCSVRVEGPSAFTGVAIPYLAQQTFYLVKITTATQNTKEDENQYLVGVPGCALAKI